MNAVETLEWLVDEWRKTRSPEVAALVEELGAKLDAALPPITGKLTDFHPAWMAVAGHKRAADVPRLLASILHTTQQSGNAITKALLERGEALSTWPADPRISLAIAKHLQSGPFNATGKAQQPFWTTLFALVERHDDARAIDAFAALNFAKIWKGWNDVRNRIAFLQPAVDGLVAKLGRPRPVVNAVDLRAMRKAIDGPIDAKRLALPAAPTVKAKPKKPAGVAAIDVRAALAAVCDDELDGLLDAWRATRAPAIAQLVFAMSKRIEMRQKPITGDTRKAIHDEWLAIAGQRRPADLPRLLASITHTFHRATDALERLEALEDSPPDPRAAAGVIANLEEIPFYTSSTKPFWSALIRFAVSHGDHGTADELDRVAGSLDTILRAQYTDLTGIRTWFRNQIQAAAAELRARSAEPLDEDIAREVASLAKKLGERAAPTERLFAAVAATPDDDEPRHVLADHLQELGDPRGELIALQLSGADFKRQNELIELHLDTWLGPLARFAWNDGCAFERGFLHQVSLYEPAPETLDATVGDPIWATVRRLSLAYDQPLPEAFLRNPALHLEHLGLCEPEQIRALMEWDVIPYRSLGFDSIQRDAIDVKKLSHVRALEFGGVSIDSPAKVEFLLAALRLETVTVSENPEAISQWVERLTKTRVRRFKWHMPRRGLGALELTRATESSPFVTARVMTGGYLTMKRLEALVAALGIREVHIINAEPPAASSARSRRTASRTK
jgi:uncharacterized protein (TIGR02996 family)